MLCGVKNLRLNDLLPYHIAQLVDQCGHEHFLLHVVIFISRVNEVKEQFCALYIKRRVLYSVVSAVLGLPAGRWFTNEKFLDEWCE